MILLGKFFEEVEKGRRGGASFPKEKTTSFYESLQFRKRDGS